MPARKTRDVLGLRDFDKRFQAHIDVMGKPGLDALCDIRLVDCREMLVGEKRESGLERVVACGKPADFLMFPDDLPLARQGEGGIRGGSKPIGACCELMNKHFGGCVARRLAMYASGCRIRREAKTLRACRHNASRRRRGRLSRSRRTGCPCRACSS